ncbi:MAG: phospholipid carrier-dependent glycosyltransferase [Clostridia bacterium]|nr:phospholipid carrier-dependent glycosyltransferase [Clostridia bacterium]
MKKRTSKGHASLLCAVLALILTLCLPWAAWAEDGDNLLKNGDFSEIVDGDPAGWRRDMWLTDAGVSLLTVDEDGYDGSCVTVTNVDENDARFAQTVSVEPDALYRVSGMIRASDVDPEGYGATLSIENVFVYSDGLYDTGGEWEYVELYGNTGPDQNSLTVFARVGAYGTLSRGTASFDNLSVTRVDEAPEDAAVYDFFQEYSDYDDDDEAASGDDGAPVRNTEAWLLFTCVYALAVVGFTRKRRRAAEPMGKKAMTALMGVALLLALVLRLVLAARVRGYNTDINCFSSWSERIFTLGPNRFYDPEYFCDYPPLYMLMLWVVAALRRLLGIATGTGAYLVLLKLIPILADLVGAVLVWRVARRKLSQSGAALLGLMMAFNPAAIANSAAWGQIDAVLALFIALCALYAADGRTVPALLCFGAALLVKPQALLFGPVGLTAVLCGIFCAQGDARRRRIKDALVGLVACLALIYAVGLVCCLGQPLTRPVTWLYALYTETLQGYRYVTVNTLNLHYLLGMNWAGADDHAGVITLAWILFGLAQAGCIVLTIASRKQPRRLFLTGGLLMVLICTFGPMIHERYIFPALLLLALAFACERDRRLLIALTVLTCTLFLNEILVLQGGMTEANFGHLQDSEHWLNCIVSAVNVLNALFLGWTAFDLCVRDHAWPMGDPQREKIPAGIYTLTQVPNYRMGIKRPDVLLMGAVTLLYSVLAFTNLGVTQAPQSGWTASQSGEAVVFDLGQTESWRMTYYGGICNSTFTVELSNDGETWSEPTFAQYNQGEIFRWLWFVPLDADMNELYGEPEDNVPGAPLWTYSDGEDSHPMQTARYARITAQSAGLILYEVGFLDGEGHPLPIAGVSQSGQTDQSNTSAATLIDEQHTVAAYPGYLNSTYFDEIYHARTAFEHLHGMNAYEWTHPPLGKVLMMVGIQLFGMTPFGWRFMGALVGVLMVPLMYLMAKQLTKDTRLSFIAMALMALDSMHFTQTRIATIDSYAVFWIMLMYLFMFRYCQMSWNRESLGQTLVPLGLCGVTMGVAWATKWVGLYASAGLAILFFWTVYRRLREAFALRRGGQARQFNLSMRNLVITLAFCLLFFIVVPVLIYYFSYFWLLKAEGVHTFGDMLSSERVDRVIQLQKSIFDYHAGLGGDTHYFRSPWYQWPVIWWPMWYFSGTGYMPEGTISSISCMGNPAVWWFGLAAIIFVTARMCWVRRASKKDVMVVIGFASQFLPWVIVPRSTFIYHYFASVPFIILASALLLDAIRRKNEKAFSAVSGGLLAAAAILFAAFYPLESGLPCSREYAKYLRWFKWYNY